MPLFARKIGKLDATSIKALREMLPTPEEKGGLLVYMKKCGSSEEAKTKAYADLSECEKYMYTMLDVSDAAGKFDCMLFRSQFQARFDEVLDSVETVEKACDEVRGSEKLKVVMAMILTLVNQINTGGDGNEAAGFTLDALLKLNEVSNAATDLLVPRLQALLTNVNSICLRRRKRLIRKQASCTIW